ncbi:hypothetical protein KC909_02185 [Candidatus Dojkabacteria bacterium]|uniref:Uncharacterized protein n=1 Tax=Candidatus Dojkabacteria bacterium TaxID=2099670 RepID=A0A955L597_9BACT|nr:hypothetical protein [Candidatus Dojkabacteria bacterium]
MSEQALIQEVARKLFTHSLIDGVLPLKGANHDVEQNAYFIGQDKFGFTDMNAGCIIPGGPLDVLAFEHVFGYDGYLGHMLAQEVQIYDKRMMSLHLIARVIQVVEEDPEYFAFRNGQGSQVIRTTDREVMPITTMAVSMFAPVNEHDFRYGYRVARPQDLDSAMPLTADYINQLGVTLRNNARDIKPLKNFGTRLPRQESYLSTLMMNGVDFF